MKQWYAVYTKPRAEKKVAEFLTRKNVEVYCPLQNVKKISNDRKQMQEPVFTSYVFVRIAESELDSLKKTDGVLNLLYWQGNPVVIRNIEIEMIQRFLNEHIRVQLEQTSVTTGEIVRLITDPFFIQEENDVMFVKHQVEKLVLPSLGYVIVADKIIKKRVPSANPNLPKQRGNYKYGNQQ